MSGLRQYFLVAGIDYVGALDFRVYCGTRKEMIISSNSSGEELLIHLFDFQKGILQTTRVTYKDGKPIRDVTEVRLGAEAVKGKYVRRQSRVDTTYTPGQPGLMTILDVYSKWADIGKSEPGTLHEVHFFSHGWLYGPVLINSNDAPNSQGPRNPHDGDPRVKDFNLDEVNEGSLRMALHKDAFFWCWGCSFPDDVHKALSCVERSKDYKAQGLKDDVVLRLNPLTREEISMFKDTSFQFGDNRKPTIEFGKFKAIIKAVVKSSYYYHLALCSGRKVYAAVPGTYAVPEPKKKGPLMVVVSSLYKHLRFYENYLEFTYDKEGRNYGEFKPVLMT